MPNRAGGTPTRRYDRIINLDEENSKEHAYLVAVETESEDALFSAEDSLQELAALATTAGAEVVGTMAQRLKSPHPSTMSARAARKNFADCTTSLDSISSSWTTS